MALKAPFSGRPDNSISTDPPIAVAARSGKLKPEEKAGLLARVPKRFLDRIDTLRWDKEGFAYISPALPDRKTEIRPPKANQPRRSW